MAVQVYPGDSSQQICNSGIIQACSIPVRNSGASTLPYAEVSAKSHDIVGHNWISGAQETSSNQANMALQNKASYDVPPTFCMNNTTPLQSNIKAEENDTSKTIFQYPCPKCSKAFKRGDHLKRHLVRVHDDEHPYLCGDCPKGFPSVDDLAKHNQESHFGIVTKGPYCAWCKSRFDCIEAIEMHANKIHKKQDAEYMEFINKTCKVFGCVFCHKTVANEKNLLRHIEKMHGDSRCQDGIYCCLVCETEFESAAKLEKHCDEKHRNNETKKIALKKTKVATPGNFSQKSKQKKAKLSQTDVEIKANNQFSNQFSYPIQNGLSPPPLNSPTTTNPFLQNKSAFHQVYTGDIPYSPRLIYSLTSNNTDLCLEPSSVSRESSSVSAALSSALQALSEFSYDDLSCHDYDYVPAGFSSFHSSPLIPNFHYPRTIQCSNITDETNKQTSVDNSSAYSSCVPHSSSFLNQTAHIAQASLPIRSNVSQRPTDNLSRETNGTNAVENGKASAANSANDAHLIAKRGRPKKKGENEIDCQTMSFIKKLEDGIPSKFYCSLCNEMFKNVNLVMSHIESVHLVANPQECCICKKRFAQAGNVKRHIRFVHLRERPFQCSDCDSTFDRLCYLQRHMRSHVGSDNVDKSTSYLSPCYCPECGQRCLTVLHLRGHLQRRHYPKSKKCSDDMELKYGHIFDGIQSSDVLMHLSQSRIARKPRHSKATTNTSSLVENNGNVCDAARNVKSSKLATQTESASRKLPQTTHLEAMLRNLDQNDLNGKTEIDNCRRSASGQTNNKANFSVIGFESGLRKRRSTLPFKCQKCINRSFVSLSFLKSHIAITHHSTMRRHLCFQCGRSYSTKAALFGHTLKWHGKRCADEKRLQKRVVATS